LPQNYPERAAYVAAGAVEVDGRTLRTGEMAIFEAGKPAVVRASEKSVVMALGGEPLGPRFIEWNFVSSSKERIEQAKADWRAGRMKLPDLDHDEFVPLPS
jgi:redox-sensitive bicupin YhaK (pirin superfamily)